MNMRENEFELDDLEGLELEEFDPALHLISGDAIEAYMTDILASCDVALIQSAVGDVMRAQGMARKGSERYEW